MIRKRLMAACFAAALLAACGGDGDDDEEEVPPVAVTDEVPASASESAVGFIAYLKELVVASADTLEPVDVSAVKPPADDEAEPESLAN